jgi:hypothetical protein
MIRHWGFVILSSLVIDHSSFFRHWSLGIRHSCQHPGIAQTQMIRCIPQGWQQGQPN